MRKPIFAMKIRRGSTVQLFTALSLIVTCSAILLFARSEYQTAVTSQRIAKEATAQLVATRLTIYNGCVKRNTYDIASNNARAVEVQTFTRFRAQEWQNPFIDEKLRAARVQAWTDLIIAMQKPINDAVKPRCDEFLPSKLLTPEELKVVTPQSPLPTPN